MPQSEASGTAGNSQAAGGRDWHTMYLSTDTRGIQQVNQWVAQCQKQRQEDQCKFQASIGYRVQLFEAEEKWGDLLQRCAAMLDSQTRPE